MRKLSNQPSLPNRSPNFGGKYIGEYNETTAFTVSGNPSAADSSWYVTWTDMRADNGYKQNAMSAKFGLPRPALRPRR